MGTPFIKLLEPSDLSAYNPNQHYSNQSAAILSTFIDAMEVREKVFVEEQGVPLANEFDSDDPRSCHWVIYASISTVTQPLEIMDGKVMQAQKSITRSVPIGTIRLVPFPHHSHPEPGSKFTFDSETSGPPPTYIVDRATSYHDGMELYIKLGRLAVLKEHRGKTGGSIAKQLTGAALQWLRENPKFFNPSIAEEGMENLVVTRTADVPVWKGLICVHAQELAERFWARWGFKADEGMGKWEEEGIVHVGMFLRLDLA